jgi:hypothetical protein
MLQNNHFSISMVLASPSFWYRRARMLEFNRKTNWEESAMNINGIQTNSNPQKCSKD